MDDIYAIRRRNLHRLLASPPLSKLRLKKDVALALNLSASMFSQVLHDDYRIGDDLARNIERLMNMEPGSMDWRGPSQSVRTNPDRLKDAMYLLEQLGELQAAPGLPRDPVALAIAYDFLEEFDQQPDHGNVLDITKRLAAKLRDQNAGDNEKKEAG